MKLSLKWNENMQFLAQSGASSVLLDAKRPLGQESGPTPKEMVAMGLAGCTAMDVIALLKKHKQLPQRFDVRCEVEHSPAGQHPAVFVSAALTFEVEGAGIDPAVLLESVKLSQTRYCGVSAMLSKAFPIGYQVLLNGEVVGRGEARF